MTPENRELHDLVDQIDDEGQDLTSWEAKFIGDLIDRRAERFTPKQAGIIRQIHDRRVS